MTSSRSAGSTTITWWLDNAIGNRGRQPLRTVQSAFRLLLVDMNPDCEPSGGLPVGELETDVNAVDVRIGEQLGAVLAHQCE